MTEDIKTSRVRFVPETGAPSPSAASRRPGGEQETGQTQLIRYRTENESNCTTPCNIIFPQSVYQRVVAYLKHDTSREHGGFLLGYEYHTSDSDPPTVVIEDAVDGRFTEGTPVRLKFTFATFRDLDEAVEARRAPDRVLQRIGWYHSHPNISIFLSHWDLDVCTVFDRREFPIALVVDPVNDRGGFFVRGKKGYQADCPQGFLEKCDVSPETLVNWSNVVRENSEIQGVADPADQTNRAPETAVPTPGMVAPRYQKTVAVCALLALAMSCLLAVAQFRMWRELKRLGAVSPKLLLNPDEATLKPGEERHFVVQSSGKSASSDFKWSLEPADQEAGSISSDGTYVAPPAPAGERTVTVKATSSSDPTQSATALVRLMPGSKPSTAAEPSVTITPSAAELGPRETMAFRVAVSGLAPGVKWSLIKGGLGSISQEGVYSAPTKIATELSTVVKAESTAEPGKFGTATVRLTPTGASNAGVAIELYPQTSTLGPGEHVRISAEVKGSNNHEVQWSYSPQIGTLQGGAYTAPSSIKQHQVIEIKGTSKAAPAKSATMEIILKPSASTGPGQKSNADKSPDK